MKRQVVLTWEGKERALAAIEAPVEPLELEEEMSAAGDQPLAAPRRIIRGDALVVARALEREGLQGQVDLIYVDPPYASGLDYSHEERMEGSATGRIARSSAYRDRWEHGPASYLDMLMPRLAAMKALLKPTGSMWIQVDWRSSYLVRSLCDEIFGRERFLNEIVWRRAPNLGRQARSGQFGRTLDTLIVYGAGAKARLVPPDRLVPIPRRAARRDALSGRWFTLAPRGDYTDASVARLEAEGRIHRTASGNVSIKYWLDEDATGTLCRRQPVDTLWLDIPPLRHVVSEERTGYPTQKPRALLERVIAAASPPGGLIVDLFAGSGTTASAALRLGRGFIVGDQSPVAIATMRRRLLREAPASLRVERCGARHEPAQAALEIRASEGDRMVVTLLCRPGTEPIAWAVSLEASPGAPFRIDWHAERGTGRRPTELCLTAVLPRSPSVRARVYFVDGHVAVIDPPGPSLVTPFATKPKTEPTFVVEAGT